MTALIPRIESGDTSRELADEVLVALGVYASIDGSTGFMRRISDGGTFPGSMRPNPLLSLDDAVGLVGGGLWSVSRMDMGPQATVLLPLPQREDYLYGMGGKGDGPTPTAALTIAILRARGVV